MALDLCGGGQLCLREGKVVTVEVDEDVRVLGEAALKNLQRLKAVAREGEMEIPALYSAAEALPNQGLQRGSTGSRASN